MPISACIMTTRVRPAKLAHESVTCWNEACPVTNTDFACECMSLNAAQLCSKPSLHMHPNGMLLWQILSCQCPKRSQDAHECKMIQCIKIPGCTPQGCVEQPCSTSNHNHRNITCSNMHMLFSRRCPATCIEIHKNVSCKTCYLLSSSHCLTACH